MRRNIYIEGLTCSEKHPFRKDADKLTRDFETEAFVKDGVVRWNSNKRIPPIEILDFWKYIGLDFDYEKSLKIQNEEDAIFIAQYKESMKNYKPSEEEIFEMRAAFGAGEKVVNIITGQMIQL